MGRLEAIQKIVESSPNDPFPRYGLAMELKNAGRLDEARAAFEELERRFPDYTAQYLMHLQLLVAMGRVDDARALGGRGLQALRKKGDAHALGELEAAIAQLDDP
jgi:Flp pilus assembly protein TadD